MYLKGSLLLIAFGKLRKESRAKKYKCGVDLGFAKGRFTLATLRTLTY